MKYNNFLILALYFYGAIYGQNTQNLAALKERVGISERTSLAGLPNGASDTVKKKSLNKMYGLDEDETKPKKMKMVLPNEDDLDKKLKKMYQDKDLECKSVTLQTKSIDIKDLFEIVGKAVGINFVVDPQLKGTLGVLNLKDTRATDVLRLIARQSKPEAAVVKLDDVWYVTSRKEARNLLRDVLGEKYEHKALSVNHSRMDKDFLEKVERGWQNLVKDVPESYLHFEPEQKKIFVCSKKKHVKAFYQYLKVIDKPILQIRIDVIIVMASKEFFMDFGIDWSGIYNRENTIKANSENFGFYGLGGTLLDFPSPSGVDSSTASAPLPVVPTPPNRHNPNLFVNPLNFAINLFDSGLSFFSSEVKDRISAGLIRLPFVFGGPDLSLRRLNLVLNMAEVEDKINIVSRPSILTSNNKVAKILIGQSIPLQQSVEDVTSATTKTFTTVNYKDTGIVLEVMPLVNPDKKSVYLNILVEESAVEAGSTRTNDKGVMTDPPTISMIKTKNEVVLKNGQTTIIGGLSSKRTAATKRSVPFISRIPVIGNLFKATFESNKERERYIFITPKIIECET